MKKVYVLYMYSVWCLCIVWGICGVECVWYMCVVMFMGYLCMNSTCDVHIVRCVCSSKFTFI